MYVESFLPCMYSVGIRFGLLCLVSLDNAKMARTNKTFGRILLHHFSDHERE